MSFEFLRFAHLAFFHKRGGLGLPGLDWAKPGLCPDASAITMKPLSDLGVESLEFRSPSRPGRDDPAAKPNWVIVRFADLAKKPMEMEFSLSRGLPTFTARIAAWKFESWMVDLGLVLARAPQGRGEGESWAFARRPEKSDGGLLPHPEKHGGDAAYVFNRATVAGLLGSLAASVAERVERKMTRAEKAAFEAKKQREKADPGLSERIGAAFPERPRGQAMAIAEAQETGRGLGGPERSARHGAKAL